MLARSKDQRAYAVIDYTEGGWLSGEIDKRALNTDLSQFHVERGKAPATAEPKKTIADFRAELQKAKAKAGNTKLDAVFDVFLAMPDADVQQLIDAGNDGKPAMGVMMKHLPKLTVALRQFDAKEMGKVFAGLAMGKYRRSSFPFYFFFTSQLLLQCF